jgi:hypothetical protein
MKVYELMRQLILCDPNVDVRIEGFRKGDDSEEHNRTYEVANVEQWRSINREGVSIFGWEVVETSSE